MSDAAMTRAREWADAPWLDEQTRAEVRSVLQDPEEAHRRFGHELRFGTGGLRGVLGAGTDRMNRYTVARATLGLSRYLRRAGGASVALSYDSRVGSREFAGVAAGVLCARGVRVWMYDRLEPTPMLSFAVRALSCDAGVMITASHNPAIYNGYKVYGPDGCQITEEAAADITKEIERVSYAELAWEPEEEARASGMLRSIPQSVYDDFLALTLACRVHPDADAPITVCYTPLNGAGREPVLDALGRMRGVTVVPVLEQMAPDGAFPTCPKPNPELKEALALALQTARQAKADLVVATDPDCDRVGVAVRGPVGEYRILTGNEVGLLLLEGALKARKASGALPEKPVVVKTIVTSDLAFPIAKTYGAEVVETLTGFKYIGEEIGRLEALGQESRYVFGFEESCGYLAGAHVRDKDGVMAAVLVAELAQYAAASGGTLLTLLSALYARYGHMRNRLLNFDLTGADPMAVMADTMRRLRARPPETLGGALITCRKDYLPGLDGLPSSDVLSYESMAGKAIVRPSGTEPKVKVYLSASAPTDEAALNALSALERDARAWLSESN